MPKPALPPGGHGVSGMMLGALAALHLSSPRPPWSRSLSPPALAQMDVGGPALVSLCCSAVLLLSGPAQAAISMESAIAEVADASYPILRAASPASLSKLAGLAGLASPAELAKAIDLGLDVALSVPADKAAAASAALGTAVSELSPATCELFPLQSLQSLQTTADPTKLAAARKLLPPKLPGTEGGICLPPRASLKTLVLTNANTLAAADAATLSAFEAQADMAFKTIPIGVEVGAERCTSRSTRRAANARGACAASAARHFACTACSSGIDTPASAASAHAPRAASTSSASGGPLAACVSGYASSSRSRRAHRTWNLEPARPGGAEPDPLNFAWGGTCIF